jgi:hypothetical protein
LSHVQHFKKTDFTVYSVQPNIRFSNKGKRGYSASKFLLLFISIVFYVDIKIQVTEMPTTHNFSVVQIASTKNSVNGVFLTIWGNKVNTFSPVLAYITPDFDNITPLFDLISLFVSCLY